MPRMTKSETGEPLDVRKVILVTKSLDGDYSAMCAAIGENQSEHIRAGWEAEVAQWKAAKK